MMFFKVKIEFVAFFLGHPVYKLRNTYMYVRAGIMHCT